MLFLSTRRMRTIERILAAALHTGSELNSRRKMEYKLYVGNLAYDVSELDLQELFAQAGAVK